jgi:uncharacterized protein
MRHTFHVHGMRCRSCALTIESELAKTPEVQSAKASLDRNALEVEGVWDTASPSEIAERMTAILRPHGYEISLEKQDREVAWSEFKIAIPVALAFAAAFILLQKLGVVNLVDASEVTYGTAFLIGAIASVSSCMAVVGGLLLSMSATFAKDGDRIRPQMMFHASRLVAFFVLGGVIGAIGSAFTLNATATFVLGVVIALVMLVLGLKLLDTFEWARHIVPSMPSFIAKRAHAVSRLNHTLTPALVGVATFFLPCGFTQSMQLYTLSTGGFLSGGFTMLAFALGTLPVLAVLSFSSAGLKKNSRSGVFFKSAGLIVILFALLNLVTSLAAIGLIPPLLQL